MKAKAIFYRIMVRSGSPKKFYKEAQAYLVEVAKKKNGGFVDLELGPSLKLRWSHEDEHFSPKSIGFSTNRFFDIFSIDEVHNRIFIKWQTDWLAYENMFKEQGIYRLTIRVECEGGFTSEILLFVKWTGIWNETEVWESKAVPV